MANYRSLAGGFFSADPYDTTVPLSIRANNPGAVNGAVWEEAMPGYVTTVEKTPGNKTTIFETPEHGVAVYWELLRRYRDIYSRRTIREIITRYIGEKGAPDYIASVTKQTGLSADTVVDLSNDAVLLPFAKAQFRHEAGKPTPLLDAQILYGFALARRGKAAVTPTPPAPSATPAPAQSWLTSMLAALAVLFKRGSVVPTPATPSTTLAPTKPVWYAAAEKDIGFHETGVNRGIEKFIAAAKTGSLGDPWCAIWINAKLEAAGIRGSRSPAARSFERSDHFIKLTGPAFGAIVTMWRGSPGAGTGHVFLYDGQNDKGARGIGANESDGVRRSYHDRNRIVGYYWPKSIPLPAVGVIRVSDDGSTLTGSET